LATSPRIGITAGPASEQQSYGLVNRFRVTANYVTAITEAGGVPLVLPPQPSNHAALIEVVDGLLLTGGADIDPQRYGDPTRHPETDEVDELRDSFEIELTKLALDWQLPIFCICRGIQVLNVALGGTLYQDLPTQYEGALQHRQQRQGVPADMPFHTLQVESGTLLAEVYGSLEIQANSLHHQAIRDIASHLTVNAWAEDGVIEAASVENYPFALAVQWHPELMYERHPEQLAPFRRLVAAASVYRSDHSSPTQERQWPGMRPATGSISMEVKTVKSASPS
jgi:putative glutamine amidotransferase